jgi:hypothetical protein
VWHEASGGDLEPLAGRRTGGSVHGGYQTQSEAGHYSPAKTIQSGIRK